MRLESLEFQIRPHSTYMNERQFYPGAIDATGCISNAWELIKPNYWLYFGISLVVLLITFGVSCIPIIGIAMLGPVIGGVYFVALRAMRGEPVDFGMMFKGFEKFVPLLLISVIQGIPSMIGQVLNMIFRVGELLVRTSQGSRGNGIDFYQSNFQSNTGDIALAGGMLVVIIVVAVVFAIISIAWGITFAFAIPIAMDQNVDAIAAIKLSARAGWSNIGGIIILAILLALVGLAGFIVCGFGFLFVLPIINVSWAFAYRQVFPDLSPASPFRNEPPPPQTYDGSFGRGM